MSVSGVGGSNAFYPDWASLARTRSDSAAQKAATTTPLGQALASAALGQGAVQSVTAASGGAMNTADANTFSQAMTNLTQAVNSGDVNAAKDAYSKVKVLLQSSGVHGHHHHHGGSKPAAAASSTDPSSTDPTDPFAAAFGSIGQSLQAGDLGGAATALSQLDSLLQGAQTSLTAPSTGPSIFGNPSGGTVDLTA